MLVTRAFRPRRLTLLGLAGALVLCTFFVLPQGQAAAAALFTLFRGQKLEPYSTDLNHLRAAYAALQDLARLGHLQGTVPRHLETVGNIDSVEGVAGFKPARPNNFTRLVAVKASRPSQVTLTLDKRKADAFLKSVGSKQTLPAEYDGALVIVDFPGASVLEYLAPSGGKLYVGQAGQLAISVSDGNLDKLRGDLNNLQGLSSGTVATLGDMQSWQTTIPLPIPTDRVSWRAQSVTGAYAGDGVILNDNTGIGSALVWQTRSGEYSVGVAGKGFKSSELQTIAGGLR